MPGCTAAACASANRELHALRMRVCCPHLQTLPCNSCILQPAESVDISLHQDHAKMRSAGKHSTWHARSLGTQQAPRWMHRNANNAGGVAAQHRVEALLLQVHDPSGAIGRAHCTKFSCRRQRQRHHWLLMLHLHCVMVDAGPHAGPRLQPGRLGHGVKDPSTTAAPSTVPQGTHERRF